VEGAKKKSGGGGKKNSGGSNSDGGGKKKKSNNSKSGGSSEKRKKSRSSPPADSGGGGSSSGGAAPVASQPPKPSDFQNDPVQSYPGETLIGKPGSTFVVSDPEDVTIGGNLTGTETIETDAGSLEVIDLGGGRYEIEFGMDLENFAEIENVSLTGGADISAGGNALGNVITGNSGANTLDGGSGSDTLRGGLGNDVYIVDSAADLVEEAAAGGTDEVRAYVDWVLGAELERLTLLGSATFATGNSSNNVITGNNYNNTLSAQIGSMLIRNYSSDYIYE
jgi:Ca2+-binding RTX toxin-like protein